MRASVGVERGRHPDRPFESIVPSIPKFLCSFHPHPHTCLHLRAVHHNRVHRTRDIHGSIHAAGDMRTCDGRRSYESMQLSCLQTWLHDSAVDGATRYGVNGVRAAGENIGQGRRGCVRMRAAGENRGRGG